MRGSRVCVDEGGVQHAMHAQDLIARLQYKDYACGDVVAYWQSARDGLLVG